MSLKNMTDYSSIDINLSSPPHRWVTIIHTPSFLLMPFVNFNTSYITQCRFDRDSAMHHPSTFYLIALVDLVPAHLDRAWHTGSCQMFEYLE